MWEVLRDFLELVLIMDVQSKGKLKNAKLVAEWLKGRRRLNLPRTGLMFMRRELRASLRKENSNQQQCGSLRKVAV